MTITLLISVITNTLCLLAGVLVGAAVTFWFKTISNEALVSSKKESLNIFTL